MSMNTIKTSLFLFLICLNIEVIAQETLLVEDLEEVNVKINLNTNWNKSAGDTLWYEDFGNGFVPNGWISTDLTGNSFDWIYTTAAPGGQYSSTVPAITSTTHLNGFASLPSDYYNTPTPANGFQKMDAYLTSGPIVISPKRSVKVRLQQGYRYCCSSATDSMELQVSSDKINWTSFNVKLSSYPNEVVNSAIELDITSVAANQDTIYIRFYQSASHYYWMIDDIAIVEGYNNAVVMDNVAISNGDGRLEYYTKVPVSMASPIQLKTHVRNVGGEPASNLKLDVRVLKDNAVVYSTPSTPIDTLKRDSSSVLSSAIYANQDGIGKYQLIYSLSSDSVNELFDEDTIHYEITDSIYAKDLDQSFGSVSSGSFGFPSNDGGIVGTRFHIDSTNLLTSISYLIGASNWNVGVGVKAQVWGFDTSFTSITDMIMIPGLKYEGVEYFLDSNNVGNWLDFKVDPPILLDSGQYVLALKQTFGDSINRELTVGRALNAEKYHPNSYEFGTYININGSNPLWGWTPKQPMMRMHFMENSQPKQLEVMNTLGQTVFVGQIPSNVSTTYVDLSHLDKGIYFIVAQDDLARRVEKVILK